MQEIVLTFKKNGEVQVEANGFKGTSCSLATEFLKKTLGKVTDFQRKAEWFEENIQKGVNTNLCG